MLIPNPRLSGLAALGLVSLLTFRAFDQTPQTLPADRQIRVQSGEVVVDVSVTSGGKPVRGLTEADFEIYENGIRQNIASFRFISGSSLDNSQIRPGTPDPLRSGALPADTAPISYPHLTSLVFDKVDMERGDAMRAMSAASAYAEKILGKDDLACVLGVSIGVRIFQHFTGNREDLLKAIREAASGGTRVPGDMAEEIRVALAGIPSGIIPGVSSDAEKMALAYNMGSQTEEAILNQGVPAGLLPQLSELRTLLIFQSMDQDIRSDRSLSGLLAIVEGQKLVPGRKQVIFFSAGYTLPSSRERFLALISAANRAGVTIHCVDVAGLRGDDPDAERQAAETAAFNTKGIQLGPRARLGQLEAAAGLNKLGNLEMLSDETGGYTLRNTNDVAAAMRSLSSYMDEYYVLTYVPSNLVTDGSFRTTSVKLKRSGFNVRARKGYYAFPDTDRFPLLGYEAEMLADLTAKSPPRGFPAYVGGYAFPGSDTTATAACFVQFPLSQLKIEKDNETRSYLAQADILLLIRRADGSIVRRLSRQLDLAGSLEKLEVTRQRDFSYYRTIPLLPGDYALEAAVRDRRTGKTSVRKAAFRVPPADASGMQVSDILLGKGSVLGIKGDSSADPPQRYNPLQVDGADLLPDLSGIFRQSSDTEVAVYFAFSAVGVSPGLRANLEFYREGVADLKLAAPLPPPDAAGRIPCLTRVKLDKFKPGKYELRVTAGDGEAHLIGTARFQVER